MEHLSEQYMFLKIKDDQLGQGTCVMKEPMLWHALDARTKSEGV